MPVVPYSAAGARYNDAALTYDGEMVSALGISAPGRETIERQIPTAYRKRPPYAERRMGR